MQSFNKIKAQMLQNKNVSKNPHVLTILVLHKSQVYLFLFTCNTFNCVKEHCLDNYLPLRQAILSYFVCHFVNLRLIFFIVSKVCKEYLLQTLELIFNKQQVCYAYKNISLSFQYQIISILQAYESMSKRKKRQINLCSEEEIEKKEKLQLTDFSLTNDQRLIIMSKLPKLFSLQPVKNLPIKNKNQAVSPIKKDKSKQVLAPELEKPPCKILHKKQWVLIQQNQNELVQRGIRKSQRMFLTDNNIDVDQKDIMSQYQNIHQTNPSQILPTDVDLTLHPSSQVSEKSEPQITDFLEYKNTQNKHSNKKKNLSNNESMIKQIHSKSQQQLINKPQKVFDSQSSRQPFEKQWQILNSLKKHSLIKPFLFPVDQILDKAKDYYKFIKQPMDLSTIQSKLKQNVYKQPQQFHKDIEKMWMNSLQFNRPLSGMAKITKELKRFYLNLLKTDTSKSETSKQIKKKRKR